MRRQKRNYRLKPYMIGVLFGYAAMVLTIFPAALILTLMKSASKTAGAAAVIAMMIGGFVCGKTAGFVRQKDGLKTGFLCGLAFSVPMMILTLIFGNGGAGTLVLKIALCASFAAVGGVSGVSN